VSIPITNVPGRLPAPCAPRTDAHLVLRPLGIDQVEITGGFWGQWQDRNREVTTPHSLKWLERDGAMDNLRRLGAADAGPERKGMPLQRLGPVQGARGHRMGARPQALAGAGCDDQ